MSLKDIQHLWQSTSYHAGISFDLANRLMPKLLTVANLAETLVGTLIVEQNHPGFLVRNVTQCADDLAKALKELS